MAAEAVAQDREEGICGRYGSLVPRQRTPGERQGRSRPGTLMGAGSSTRHKHADWFVRRRPEQPQESPSEPNNEAQAHESAAQRLVGSDEFFIEPLRKCDIDQVVHRMLVIAAR